MKTNLSIRRHALRLGQYPCQRVPRRRSPGLGGWGATRMLRLGLPVLSLLCGPALLAATFTVTTTDDSGPGSLRAAMFSANASPGADTIAFNLPGAGVQTISPLTQLPTLTNAVTLDGYTQPGSQANTLVVGNDARPLIRLDGRLCTSVQPAGLRLTGSGLVVRGLVIVKFARGLVLDTCNNSTVAGNWIGLDVDNLPSPNIFEGVQVTCPVFSSSGGILIGGSAPADRNVISGNSTGISFSGQTVKGCRAEGNYIGTDASGTSARPNTIDGLRIQSGANHSIGGTTVGARNVVSGNGGSGIYVLGATNVTVRGNFLGLDATGTAAMGNGQDGVVIHNSSGSYCTIGGTAAGAGNVISGNANGIYILGALTNWILGNFVGTDASGTRALGNTQSGITIFGGHGSQVGGTAAGAANRVCFNQQRGVGVSADATACEIRGNAIFANRGPGIDLNADGVSTNDFYDLDLGANETQNHPVLTNALVGASTVRVQGYLEGAAGVTLTLDFYASTNWDFDGLAEGQSWLGAASITTDAAGLAVFDTTLVAAVPAGAQITGTATDAGGNTSEFSPAALAGAGSPAPPLGLVSLGGTNYLAWPADAAGVSLEASLALGPSASWFRVSSGIVTLGGHLVFPIVPAPGVGHQFFRLVAE